MKLCRKNYLAVLTGLSLLAVLFFFAPEVARSKDQLDPAYRTQVQTMRTQLSLNDQQALEIVRLMQVRNEGERHLRKQMRTTLNPDQQAQAREIWKNRQPGQPLTDPERLVLRKQLGVTVAQVEQFEAYREKIRVHRAMTLREVKQCLYPEQEASLEKLALEF